MVRAAQTYTKLCVELREKRDEEGGEGGGELRFGSR